LLGFVSFLDLDAPQKVLCRIGQTSQQSSGGRIIKLKDKVEENKESEVDQPQYGMPILSPVVSMK
jgi:hypothetical protein